MISRFLPSRLRRFLGVTVTSRPPSHQLLDQPGSLEPLLDALDRVKEVALDTEADNMYHYRTRLCLMRYRGGLCKQLARRWLQTAVQMRG